MTYDHWKTTEPDDQGEAPAPKVYPREVKIITSHDWPPIPDRRWDWSAVTDNYDGEGSPIGHGRTEAEAIADLKDLLDDHGDNDDRRDEQWAEDQDDKDARS